jgi:hypothetical protein
VASRGLGVGCGRQFLTYGCVSGKNGAAHWIGLIRAVDDGRSGDVIGFSFACFGPFVPIPKLNNLCCRIGHHVILDTRYFDIIYKTTSSKVIIDHISSVISNVLETRDLVVFHANMQDMSFGCYKTPY